MTQYTPGIKVVDVPSGAKYVRLSNNKLPSRYAFISNTPENPYINDSYAITDAFPYNFNPVNPCDYQCGSVGVFHKCACIGDSLTWGAYNADDGYTINVPTSNTLHEWYSYPTQFTKITGVITDNLGDSSETFKTWYDLYKDHDYTGCDAAIIHLGVNDAAYSVTDEETEEYMIKVIEAVKASVMNIKIFVCTLTPVFSNPRWETYMRKSELIRQVYINNYADDPNIVLLDMERYSHVRQYTSFAAGHFTALGYRQWAQDLANYISWYIDRNMRDFRFVHYIGSDRTYSGD